jgi:HEAT repeat protein
MRLALALLLLIQSDDELKKLAANVKDYPTKFKLAKIGRPAVAPLLAQLGSKDDVLVFETKSALRWIATYASQQPAEAKALAEHLAGFLAKEQPVEARRFAAELLGETGAKEGVPALAKALADAEAREDALGSLVRIKDPSAGAAIQAALDGAGDFRAKLVLALGMRRDTEALIRLKNEPAALDALALTGDPRAAEPLVGRKAIPQLLKLAESCEIESPILAQAWGCCGDEAQRVALLGALGRRGDPSTLDIVDEAEKGSDAVRTASFRARVAIAERMKDGAKQFVRVLEHSTDEVALARALNGCARAGSAEAVAAITKLLAKESVAVHAVAALKSIPGEGATKALVAALEGPARTLAISALADRRDGAAVPALCSIAAKGEMDARLAAVRGLGRIGDPSAGATLAEVIDTSNPPLRTEALDAYLAIAKASEGRRPADARAMYLKALDLGGPVYQVPALAGLARVPEASALPAVEGLLKNATGDLKVAALNCVVAIAESMASSKREEAVKILLRAHEAGLPGLEAKLRAMGERVEITARDGIIEDWWVLGPIPAKDESDWETPYPPEKGVDLGKPVEAAGKTLRWKTARAGGEEGAVDLDSFFEQNDFVVAYAYAEVHLKKERETVLRCGSDDGIVVWVNGEKVHQNLVLRGLNPVEDAVKVKLKEGANTILMKVCEKRGGWGFAARLEDGDGRALRFKIK